jgi:translation elongation factor EF-Tu-like GTPase
MKPTFTIALLGAPEHGKTRLAEGLSNAYRGRTVNHFAGGREYQFETPQRIYHLRHGDRHSGILQYLLFGPTQLDAALLVVSATSGPSGELSAQLRLLKRLSISSVVVAMTFVDLLNDDELLDGVEVEVREMLQQEGFAGDEVPFVRGGAKEIVEVLERLMLTPRPQIDDFLMLIDERFGSSSQELIAAGRVVRGAVQVGEQVSLYSVDGQQSAALSGLDVVTRSQDHRSILDVGVIKEKRSRASRGQWVACRLPKTLHRALYDSYALAKPGTLKMYQKATALIWVENNTTPSSSWLFRMRGEKGALRRLLKEGAPNIEAKQVREVEVPPIGIGHVEVPAYFDIIAPRSQFPIGMGVFISLR